MTPSVSPRRDKEKDKDKDKDRGKNPNRLSVFTFFKKSHHSSSNKKSEKSLSSPDYHNQHNTSNSIHRSPIRDNSCDSQKSKSRRFSMVFSNSQKKKQALSISSTIQPMSPQRTEAVTITPTAAAGGRCLDNLSGVVLDPRNPSSLMQLSNPIDDEGTTGEEYAQALWNFEAKNDILAILYKKPDGWWVAEVLPKQNNPQQQGPGPRIRGLVPGNYFRPL
ncbi:hypothetical protein J3Q64DRAFT_1449460 [Phycomyces blakesleeanus]|uniref:SH3 domain-containing protein n=1 Tax=Phycomyces blakesleeanus TaxID=4837 RepID=A0ABR3AJ43_PHYBL